MMSRLGAPRANEMSCMAHSLRERPAVNFRREVGCRLRVRVLGGLAVEGVDLTRLGSRKARRLLARLALARGAPVSVDALIDTVWGDDPPSQPAEQLSVLISRLRSAMHTALPRTAAGYALEAGWLDVAALAELVAEAQARMRSGAPAPARAAAQAAL